MSIDLADTNIGFIGGGNMAQAIIRGLVRSGHRAEHIRVADPSPSQQAAVQGIDAGIVLDDNESVARTSRLLVVAVKPQVMADVVAPLGKVERPADQVVLSVAAGITLQSLEGWFGEHCPIIRVMPNQPALAGEGMSGLCANAAATDTANALASYAMAATGKVAWFDDEGLMDAVTAVSGSGPAYFYLVMEIMESVAGDFGFDAPTARMLAVQTALGAATVAASSDEPLATLRERVTSPGGTTAAALASLEAAGIRDMFRAALEAARDRSIELGKR